MSNGPPLLLEQLLGQFTRNAQMHDGPATWGAFVYVAARFWKSLHWRTQSSKFATGMPQPPKPKETSYQVWTDFDSCLKLGAGNSLRLPLAQARPDIHSREQSHGWLIKTPEGTNLNLTMQGGHIFRYSHLFKCNPPKVPLLDTQPHMCGSSCQKKTETQALCEQTVVKL